MDWSKIKTIFILTFLALDIYLLYEFFKILDTNKYEFIAETSFEEKLAADRIKYVELPKNVGKEAYMSAKPKQFNKEELEKIKGIHFSIIDGNVLQVEFEEPIKLSNDYEISELNAFVKNNIVAGEQYQYFGKSDKGHLITYYQQYQNKTFYKNKNGKLILHINDENEIFSYTQTMLEEVESQSERLEVLPPLKAIETLYDNGVLQPKTKITKVELGYFTLVQLTASQVLTPTWHFVVEDKEDLFVNAFEGQIVTMDEEEEKNLVE